MDHGNYNNLLVIAGTGRNSGKTTLARTIIERFSSYGITAVKISPHFHKASRGLIEFAGTGNYNIYTETSTLGDKDSSVFLVAGAAKVFYIQAKDLFIKEAFRNLYQSLPEDKPVICESPALGRYIDPAVLLLTDSEKVKERKDIAHLISKADHIFHPLSLQPDISALSFLGGCWTFR